VNRRIVRLDQDAAGEWVAHLGCFHRQHVRHQPPLREAAWVLDDNARSLRVGTFLDCPLCDRAELPADLAVVRTTDLWDEATIPAPLQRVHRVAPGTWGVLRVISGELRFSAHTDPPIDVVITAGQAQPIPPSIDHTVTLTGPVQLSVDFLRPPAQPAPTAPGAQDIAG
jgi:tellurite methyltransferase